MGSQPKDDYNCRSPTSFSFFFGREINIDIYLAAYIFRNLLFPDGSYSDDNKSASVSMNTLFIYLFNIS